MKVDANNFYGWAMSQEMLDNKFEWVSVDEFRAIEQQIYFADGRIAIFDLGLFDHRVLDQKKFHLRGGPEVSTRAARA